MCTCLWPVCVVCRVYREGAESSWALRQSCLATNGNGIGCDNASVGLFVSRVSLPMGMVLVVIMLVLGSSSVVSRYKWEWYWL
jgi:hypothetical protein